MRSVIYNTLISEMYKVYTGKVVFFYVFFGEGKGVGWKETHASSIGLETLRGLEVFLAMDPPKSEGRSGKI